MTSRERADQEVELRARVIARESASAEKRPRGLPLNLSISRDGVGVALTEPVPLGPLDVTRLETVLPNIRFPLDVSGGVAPFLSKRGRLASLALETSAQQLEAWLPVVLAGYVSAEAPQVAVETASAGVSVVVAARSMRAGASGRALVAWTVVPAVVGERVLWYVTRARGLHLQEPALALALRMTAAVLGASATREGARFVLEAPADRVARHLFPLAGARVPEGRGMTRVALWVTSTAIMLEADRSRPAEAAYDEAPRVLAHEIWLLTREGDDALALGRHDEARAAYLRALERAPQQAELATRIAGIDRAVGGREEAALATLAGIDGVALDRAETLRSVAAVQAKGAAVANAEARASFLTAAETDDAPLVSGAAYAEAARLSDRLEDVLTWLDLAVARAPTDGALRVARLDKSLACGRIDVARADAEHLAAAAPAGAQRYRALMDVGDAYRDAGFASEAAAHYERALVQAPEALLPRAHLGETFIAMGRHARGAALLATVLDHQGAGTLSEDERARATLSLARALGDGLDQRSVALARLRTVRSGTAVASEAFEVEATYRIALGDRAGASTAYTRMREEIAATPPEDAVQKLCRAAAFEAENGHNPVAERHLALALRLAPDDQTARALYQQIAAYAGASAPVAAVAPPVAVAAPVPAPVAVQTQPEPQPVVLQTQPEPEPGFPALDDVDAEIRVEELTQKLHASPSDEPTVLELIARLTQLNKYMELFALLSAQVENAPTHRGAEYAAAKNEALRALATQSRDAGREEEAALYEGMLE